MSRPGFTFLSLLASGDHSSRGRGKMAQEPFLCTAGLAEVLCEHETWCDVAWTQAPGRPCVLVATQFLVSKVRPTAGFLKLPCFVTKPKLM